MIKLIAHVIVLLLTMTAYSMAQDEVRVAIFPFTVHTEDNSMNYLGTEIPKIIGTFLTEEGAIIDLKSASKMIDQEEPNHNYYIEKAIEAHAEYVIWGEIKSIDQASILTATIADTSGFNAPEIIVENSENMETLIMAVSRLSKKISPILFEYKVVKTINVTGNERIESEAIKRILKTKTNEPYRPKTLSQDIERIFHMGYFDDIRVEAEKNADETWNVTFKVVEKPTVYETNVKGNSLFEEEKIKESIDISKGSILNLFKVQGAIERIENMYKEKNYHHVEVSFELIPRDNNQTTIQFIIVEGKKVLIRSITFEGNKAYKKKILTKQMATSEKGFFSWLTSSGDLDQEKLNQDVMRLAAFYHNNGYIDARVSDPNIVFDGNRIDISIKIVEGDQFYVGKVDIEGDLIETKEKILPLVKIKDEKIYNRETLRKDILLLTDVYSNSGYAFADVAPQIQKNDENHTVDITFQISKGDQVFFDKIWITGNTKTRDKVIRRELNVYEQDLYSGIRIKQSVRNLNRLDFFEDVNVETIKSADPNKLNLKIDVKEKPTGLFSFGGGYSSVDKAFIVGSISQRNLFGKGQILEAKGQLGANTNKFDISFTEPWLFDMPLSAGVDAYNWTQEYDEYQKDSVGGRIRFGYPIWRYTRGYVSYAYDEAEILDVEYDAPLSVQLLVGKNVTSSVSTTIRYDSRDRIFNPTEGSDFSFSIEHAGGILGGDFGFTKYVSRASHYFPLFWTTVGLIHAEAGFVKQHTGESIPDYELFHLGGINSLRGFDWEDISPIEYVPALDSGGNLYWIETRVGGNKYVQFNVEFIFPILREAGLMGVCFYDTGNVYKKGIRVDFGELRESAGFGFRWYSPMGPIRLEHGYILDHKPGEDSEGRWEFSMGSAF